MISYNLSWRSFDYVEVLSMRFAVAFSAGMLSYLVSLLMVISLYFNNKTVG